MYYIRRYETNGLMLSQGLVLYCLDNFCMHYDMISSYAYQCQLNVIVNEAYGQNQHFLKMNLISSNQFCFFKLVFSCVHPWLMKYCSYGCAYKTPHELMSTPSTIATRLRLMIWVYTNASLIYTVETAVMIDYFGCDICSIAIAIKWVELKGWL